jgi:Xaa-Pro aminopeptidase
MPDAPAPENPDQRLARLRAALAQAEDALYSIRQSDDRCYTNGAYDAAERVVHGYRTEIEATERAMKDAAP